MGVAGWVTRGGGAWSGQPDEVGREAGVGVEENAAVVGTVDEDAPYAGVGTGGEEQGRVGKRVGGRGGQEAFGDEGLPVGRAAADAPGEQRAEGGAVGLAAVGENHERFPGRGEEDGEEFADGVLRGEQVGAGAGEFEQAGGEFADGVGVEEAELAAVGGKGGRGVGGVEVAREPGRGLAEGAKVGSEVGAVGGEGGGDVEEEVIGGEAEAGFAEGERLGRGHAEGGDGREQQVGIVGDGHAFDDDFEDVLELAVEGEGEGAGDEAGIGLQFGQQGARVGFGQGGVAGERVHGIERGLPDAAGVNERDDAVLAEEGNAGEGEVLPRVCEGGGHVAGGEGVAGENGANGGGLAQGVVVGEGCFGAVHEHGGEHFAAFEGERGDAPGELRGEVGGDLGRLGVRRLVGERVERGGDEKFQKRGQVFAPAGEHVDLKVGEGGRGREEEQQEGEAEEVHAQGGAGRRRGGLGKRRAMPELVAAGGAGEVFPMTIHERLAAHLDRKPDTAGAVFVANNATVCGDVKLGRGASVFYGAVLRGDIHSIVIGEGSNIQDNAIVHLSDDHGTVVGDWVTVGHAATLHGCTVEDGCLIGMGAIVLDGAVIGAGSIVGAGSLVTMGFKCPPGAMVMGRPAKVTRELTAEERLAGRRLAEKYVEVARAHSARQALLR